jgi:hypothetical protein
VKFRIILPRFKWRRCLQDLADCLAESLERGGHHVEQADEFRPGTEVEIVLGAHEAAVDLPDYPVVIYQTEVPGSGWFTEAYRRRLAGALAVWEASPGFASISDFGRRSVAVPGLMRVTPHDVSKDIPLLFYGSVSERRLALLKRLVDSGLNPSVHFGVFGETRDALIDRAELVVDIKQVEGDPNDSTRTFYLDSRGACVLSENDADPKRVLAPWRLVEQCRELMGDPRKRAAHAESRRAELVPMDTGPAVAQLTGILREKNRVRVLAAS